MKIGVYGSAAGEISNNIKEKSREIGREIARRGHELITGACPGLPYEATLGANELNGITKGFSPAISLDEHINRFNFPVHGFTKLIWIPENFPYKSQKKACLKLRNVYSVAESDVAVIISGRWGTANEFSIAYDLGKNIGILKDSGGFTEFIDPMNKSFNKPSDSKIIYHDNPIELISELERVTKI